MRRRVGNDCALGPRANYSRVQDAGRYDKIGAIAFP